MVKQSENTSNVSCNTEFTGPSAVEQLSHLSSDDSKRTLELATELGRHLYTVAKTPVEMVDTVAAIALSLLRSAPTSSRHGATEFYETLLSYMKLHVRKAGDYTSGGNPFSNFEEAAEFAGISPREQFYALIGTKVSRIKSLLSDGRTPNNESLLDSFRDLAIYCTLLLAFNDHCKDSS